jgi:hypothetical protein
MTITISVPLTMPDGLTEAVRALFPFIEPLALAIAGACGAGIIMQLGLDLGLKLVQRALGE